MSESELLAGVLELLQYLQNQGKVWHTRLNSGSIIVPGKNKNYRIKLSPEGTADVMVIREGQIYFLETKAPDGGKQSPAQIEFQKKIEEQGAIYLLVRDLQEVIDEFTDSGRDTEEVNIFTLGSCKG